MQFRWVKTDYSSPAVAQGGMQKQFPWYQDSNYLNTSSLNPSGPFLGEYWWLGGNSYASGGNAFACVKALGALSFGQLVAPSAPATDTAAAGSTSSVLNLTTGGLTPGAEVGNFVFVSATGATTPQIRRIKANTANAITVALRDYTIPSSPIDKDVFDTVATATNPVSIIRPYTVIPCTASLAPIGVALGTVASGNFTIIQVAGLAAILAVGSTNAIVVGQPAVPGAGGVITGSAAAAANLYIGANIIPQFAHAGASTAIPCLVNFLGQ